VWFSRPPPGGPRVAGVFAPGGRRVGGVFAPGGRRVGGAVAAGGRCGARRARACGDVAGRVIGRQQLLDGWTIAWKELTELSNRLRFHAEKLLFGALASGAFVLWAYPLQGRSLEEMARFGGSLLDFVAVSSCILLWLFALSASSGIILSELLGNRLDLLRITSLRLDHIVLGKGLAVALKSLLLLLLTAPVIGVGSFYGGFTWQQVVQAFVITISAVLPATSMGLVVSVGAESQVDRVVRCGEWAFGWYALTGVAAGLAAEAGAAPLAAIFTPAAWALFVQRSLGWTGVAFHVVANLAAAFGLTRLAVRRMGKRRRSDACSRRSIFTRPLPAPGAAARRGGAPTSRGSFRKRAGSLVGSRLTFSNMFPGTVPVAVVGGVILILGVTGFFRGGAYFRRLDAFSMLGVMTWSLTALLLGPDSCGVFAGEKERRTAEVLASTPAGGAGMLWWKGAGILVAYVPAMLFGALLLAVPAMELSRQRELVIHLSSAVAVTALAFAGGLSFSAVSRTSARAAMGLLVTLLVVAPLVFAGLRVAFAPEMFAYGRAGEAVPVWVGVVSAWAGAVLLAFRHIWPKAALALLVVGLALALAGVRVLFVPGHDAWLLILESPLRPVASMKAAAVDLALAGFLFATAHYRFRKVFAGESGGRR